MLQQTQVQTVIPYYQRFLEAFPDIEHLARADPQYLLKTWAGLGYYSRARNLQKAAQRIVQLHGGKFPKTYEEVRALPGIGRYTAGAILSIALDRSYPVLDGNVTRVLTRLFKLKGDPKVSAFQRQLWDIAGRLLVRKRPGDFNQALMELGAIICSPRQPRCLICPWHSECSARKEGLQEAFPEKRKALVIRRLRRAVVVIQHRGRVLIIKRTGERLLQDFWEFPGGEFKEETELETALIEKIRRDLGLRIRSLQLLKTIKHAITNRRITLEVYVAALHNSARVKARNVKWVSLSEIDRYPFPSAALRIVSALTHYRPLHLTNLLPRSK